MTTLQAVRVVQPTTQTPTPPPAPKRAIGCCGFVAVVIKSVGGAVSFVVFRIFALIHPSLAPRVEAIWLRVVNIWERIKSNWEKNSLRAENQILTERVQILTARLQAQETLKEERDMALEEKGQIARQNEFLKKERDQAVEEKNAVQASRDCLIAEKQSVVEIQNLVIAEKEAISHERNSTDQENKAVVTGRDQLLIENRSIKKDRDRFKEENSRLRIDREEALLATEAAEEARREIELQLQVVRNKVQPLESEITASKVSQKINALIEQATGTYGEVIGFSEEGQDTNYGERTYNLLKLLKSQREEAINHLEVVIKPDDAASQIALQSLIRTYKEEETVLSRIVDRFVLNRSFVSASPLKKNQLTRV